MSKGKTKGLNPNRPLGTIKKKLSSGMYETDKKEKVPPFPGLEVGDKVELVDGRFKLDMKNPVETAEPVDPKDKEIADLKAKNEALENQLGEQGSKIGAIEETMKQMNAPTTATAKNEPPKAQK